MPYAVHNVLQISVTLLPSLCPVLSLSLLHCYLPSRKEVNYITAPNGGEVRDRGKLWETGLKVKEWLKYLEYYSLNNNTLLSAAGIRDHIE